ncbi:RNA polymerase II-associated [Cristinia sonorae]|uniref:RNA polymerase II-associated n=1 Tax=Cristinia sonorae TaxID=1940300 RepID=A0A8K0UT94_9AGAR|nr:RNA polymerase II-associated [Cristinia sonorae]
MSVKKSKLDLLIKVRYSNPLPAPPCPPKLLNIPTDPMRYARPEFLNDLANDTPLPMIVDAECGMPLDLGKWGCLWEEGGDDPALNPDPLNPPKLDPKDQLLLIDPASISGPYNPGGAASGTSTPTPMPHVTWLRKTEYITREGVNRSSASSEPKHLPAAPIDVSRSAQIRDIESSFAAVDEFDLSSVKHPNKPKVTAVESYEVLPDADVWANAYDLFRFSERPGDRPPDVEDPRLDCAILRPMESEGDHFLAYYLTKEDEIAIQFKEERLARDPNAPEEDEPTNFHYIRDYEVVKVEQEVPNEFLLVINDGDDEDDFASTSKPRAKGAYYKNIERKMLLKKRRVNSYQAYVDKWDIVKVTHVPMSKEEEDEREEALAEVMDPMYLLNRVDMDAEGEVEEDVEVEVERPNDGGGDIVDPIDVFGE